MEVKPGYKQTEVGVIPEEWETKSLGTVLNKGRLGGNYANQDAEAELPLMKMGNLARGYFDLSKVQFITPAVRPEPVHRLVYGDVLFNTRNTLDLVGKVAIWRDELPVAYYNSNLMRLEFDPEQVCSNEYANYALNTEGAVSRLRALATGTTSVAAIYTRDLMKLQVLVPPLPEQRAIATALSDVDGLLGGLDRLIAKKRDLKQAAMQQLLTGQTRLPGFQGEWDVKTLFELADRKKEFFDDGDWIESEHITNEGIRLIQTGNIGVGGFVEKDDKKYINEESFKSLLCKQLKQGDLLVCRLADPAGRACVLSDIGEERIVTSVDVTIFRPPSGLADRLFLSQVFSTSDWFRTVSDRSGGTTHKRISRGALGRLSINIPPLAEQTAIAEVLTEMDGELAMLEQRREKTRALKQAMMHSLLTGRIRLV
jgi:type I restriction enzyme S subunit